MMTRPSSLYARMALILLTGLLVAQGVSLWLQWGERSVVVMQARGLHFADQISRTIRVLENTQSLQRSAILPALQEENVSVELVDDNQVSPNEPQGVIGSLVAKRLGYERQIRHVGAIGVAKPGNSPSRRSFDVRLSDGQWARITIQRGTEADAPALPMQLTLKLLLTLTIVAAVVMIAVRQATRPLQQLAQAADTLGHDLDAPPMPEQGSTETRSAAQAFNRMQIRIQRLVSERARALAAVSHDLRTPLTRLSLRAELIEDDFLRDQMSADLEAMAAMIDTTLDYLRTLHTNEVVRAIDIDALLESMAEDTHVLGHSIPIQGKARIPFNGRLSALRRALQNLIDNASKHSQWVNICVEDSTTLLSITVQDNGPGIPEHALESVFEPYYRVDGSRNQPSDGVGLGLSIVRDIALMHCGELLLANRAQGGLAATLSLPRR